MNERIEIGYVCRHGHFQFKDDPDGDSCGTKKIGTIYVEANERANEAAIRESVEESLTNHHRKMEEWRNA